MIGRVTMQRFLAFRYLAMLAWFVVLIAAVVFGLWLNAAVLGDTAAPILFYAVVGLAIIGGLLLQRRLVKAIDPTGNLRRAVREPSSFNGPRA